LDAGGNVIAVDTDGYQCCYGCGAHWPFGTPPLHNAGCRQEHDELVERLRELAELKYQHHTVHVPAALKAAADALDMRNGAKRPEPNANDRQEGGEHYKSMSMQPWDVMQAWMTPEEFRGFLWGNVIKYGARWQKKGGVEDLKKQRHYLDKLIEVSADA
jgi:hypothetical protein